MKNAKILQVMQLGHPAIRTVASVVEDPLDPEIQHLIQCLFVTCAYRDGVGIAAPQVDEPHRIIIVASKPNDRYPDAPLMEPTVMINPRILVRSTSMTSDWEGCLSVPCIRALVPRHDRIKISYLDLNGEPKAGRFSGFIARIIQHEIDHLDGRVFIDRAKKKDIVTEKEYLRLMSALAASK